MSKRQPVLRKALLTTRGRVSTWKNSTQRIKQPTPRNERGPGADPGSGRQAVQALLPAVCQVRLDHLGEEVPLQQAVGERQQLGHGLVEVLRERTAALSAARQEARGLRGTAGRAGSSPASPQG